MDSASRFRRVVLALVCVGVLSAVVGCGRPATLESIAFSPGGDLLATGGCRTPAEPYGCDSGSILFWRIPKDRRSGRYIELARILTGDFSCLTQQYWAFPTHVGKKRLPHDNAVRSIAFSPDGTVLASGSCTTGCTVGEVRLWDLSNPPGRILARPWWPGKIGAPVQRHRSFVNSVAFSPDGGLLASGGADNTIALWSVDGPERRLREAAFIDVTARRASQYAPRRYESAVTSVAFSPNARLLASAHMNDAVLLWDCSDPSAPALRGDLGLPGAGLFDIAFSPDGRLLAADAGSGNIAVWRVADLALQQTLRTPGPGARLTHDVAFSPDGRFLASAGSQVGGAREKGMFLAVWDLSRTETPAMSLLEYNGIESARLAFTANSSMLVATACDGVHECDLYLWDMLASPPARLYKEEVSWLFW